MKTLLRMVPLLAVAALFAGCGEEPQVIKYEAGKYQGKSDTLPWDSAAYGGDKARWESDMRARIGNQNELRRMPAE